MNKKLNVWLPLLFAVVMIIGMYAGYRMRDGMPGRSFFHTDKQSPLQEVISLLRSKYVDSVDENALADSAIKNILSKLDPHSVFIPANDLQEINEEIKGSFAGIGIEYNIFDDSLHVINVVQGGPSDKAGLQTGDIILSAGDSIISGKKVSGERIRNLLRGPEESTVSVQLLRAGRKEKRDIKRGEIPIKSVDASYMLSPGIGFIRLNKFSSTTYREFMIALTDLKKQNLQKLILDLRANGGGVLDQAVEIADEFLSGDKLITYTEGIHSAKKEYRCRREGRFEKGMLVLLTDEGTASASEVLMGALQDWDRATIIGRRSFGKGLVQEQYDLSDQSALRLTVARYYTPLGRSIQRSYKNGGAAYYEEISNRYTDGEMISADSVHNDSSKIYRTPTGKKLFGGGGISPDVFVAADTNRTGAVTSKLYAKGTLNDFGYRYFQSHRPALKAYVTSGDFVAKFSVTEEDWLYFKSLAEKDSLNLADISPAEKTFITGILKSSIARQLFRTEGFFEALNKDDAYLRAAATFLK